MANYTKNLVPVNSFHSFNFFFEDLYTTNETAAFLKKYWKLSFVLVFFYVIAIHLGVRYMRNRPKYNLRGPLFAWNAFITAVYVFGLYRTIPEIYTDDYLSWEGFHSWMCLDCPYGCTRIANFWVFLFVLCKAPELGDTIFVVLRKQPLFFLHWYHHCTVLVLSWYLYGQMSSVGLTYALINSMVHALMYFYYALKALSIRIPRTISMALTLIQLSQMVVGVYANYYVYQVKKKGLHCSVGYTDITAAFSIYISYFCLFAWYFYKAYIAKDALIIKKFKGEKIE